MGKAPRGLSPDEAALWARLAATVKPTAGRIIASDSTGEKPFSSFPRRRESISDTMRKNLQQEMDSRLRGNDVKKSVVDLSKRLPAEIPKRDNPLEKRTLDANWDRNLARGAVAVDFTIDLHETTLDGAHGRLEHGLTLAAAQGARVVLVITGRARPVDPADRAARRGAIRAKFLDWLALGSHAGRIAAVRGAHPRHGGAGAVYVVLRRGR
ncbi:MAG: hypothetical protein RLY97_1841 [Pseudomonadota bacterium]|jgi:DNA-nicking Smr family endonuclease